VSGFQLGAVALGNAELGGGDVGAEAFSVITLVGQWGSVNGGPSSGLVTVELLCELLNEELGDIVLPSSVVCELDDTGTLTFNGSPGVAVFATNDPSTTTPGPITPAVYRIRYDFIGQSPHVFTCAVPYNTPGGALNLATAEANG
jgi:hypothetical protein